MKFNILVFLFILILIFIIYYLGYLTKSKIDFSKNNESTKMKKVSIFTDDGVEVIGDYYYINGSKFAGILIHMMPSDKGSMKKLAEILNANGYSALAIDLRGHGESINSTKGKLNYRNFSDKEHQDSIFDIKAASKFLEKEGFNIKNQFLIGASIGANLSLQFISQNRDIKAAVLISPGKNYRGLIIEDFLDKDLENRILIITSKNDTQSYSSLDVFNLKTPSATKIIYNDDLHGTYIFDKHHELYQKIINFLKEKLIE
ncbi:MAG: hypothetical protein KatS3mg095_0063 [Candidatus Parcubacteria bacterium]|nr:MAG: hypothetical protein KatS3mg095_0063 [Candidatus Parcubacteria bacterium]